MTTNEAALLQRARQFDETALAEIYDLYSPGVYRYAARLVDDSHLAEECVSETFLRYLQALRANGGPTDHLQAYLYRIAHNWITDQFRRKAPLITQLSDELQGDDDDLEHSVESADHRQRVRNALLALTPDQRQVIVLKYLEGWENEKVALALQKPVSAVKSLQHRAIEALRKVLPQKEEEAHGKNGSTRRSRQNAAG